MGKWRCGRAKPAGLPGSDTFKKTLVSPPLYFFLRKELTPCVAGLFFCSCLPLCRRKPVNNHKSSNRSLQSYTRAGVRGGERIGTRDRDRGSGPRVQSPLGFLKDLLARTTTLLQQAPWTRCINAPPRIRFCFHSLLAGREGSAHASLLSCACPSGLSLALQRRDF